nr:hypothetical protein [uncultured Desulfobacter sp.]
MTIGQAYVITGEFQNWDSKYGNPTALSFGVAIDNNILLQLDRPAGGIWEEFSVEFIAVNTSHTLSFSAERNGDDSSYAIDNIAINSVPLPTAIWFLGTGLLGILGFRSKMKK